MSLITCGGVLFDLDGVLVDSTPCVTRVWTWWALQHGFDPNYVVHVAHGRKAIETVRAVAPQLDAQKEFEEIERREIEDTDGLRVLPGARELLAALPADRYTIVTSGTRMLASRRLQAAGLPAPPNMVTADDVVQGKPHPEPYLKGAEVLGLAGSECLVFEDAPSGIRSAQAAGAKVVAVATTYRPEEISTAETMIASLAEVRFHGLEKAARLLLEIGAGGAVEG